MQREKNTWFIQLQLHILKKQKTLFNSNLALVVGFPKWFYLILDVGQVMHEVTICWLDELKTLSKTSIEWSKSISPFVNTLKFMDFVRIYELSDTAKEDSYHLFCSVCFGTQHTQKDLPRRFFRTAQALSITTHRETHTTASGRFIYLKWIELNWIGLNGLLNR